MNVIRFDKKDCGQFRRYLDSWVSGELLVETTHSMTEHTETCAQCAELYAGELRMRTAVRDAARTEMMPPELRVQISERLRATPSRGSWFSMPQWALVAASLALVTGTAWYALHDTHPVLYEVSAAEQETFIQKVSARVAPLFRAGLQDHLHCAVARKYPQAYPKPDQLKPQQQLGPEFEPLKPIVRDLVPAHYNLVLAHRCGYKDRRFVHFVFRDSVKQISVILSQKQTGETYANSGLAPVLQEFGQGLYQARVSHYTINGFETREYLGYVVSDLGQENMELAAKIAPKVAEYLNRI
ncbi:MAG: hypothetical protein U0Q16_30020 [Bryobacteraceae bacterium]